MELNQIGDRDANCVVAVCRSVLRGVRTAGERGEWRPGGVCRRAGSCREMSAGVVVAPGGISMEGQMEGRPLLEGDHAFLLSAGPLTRRRGGCGPNPRSRV